MKENNFLKNFSNSIMKVALFFVKLAIWCILIYVIGIRLFNFGHRLFRETALSDTKTTPIEFTIKEGESAEEIGERLKKEGLIDDTLAFRFRAKIYKTNFNPNTYSLDKSMSIKNMLDVFDDQDENYVVNKVEETSQGEAYQLSPEEQELVSDESMSENLQENTEN